MIKFREKIYSVNRDKGMVRKLTDKLDKERVYDYDVDRIIPKDVVSINSDLNSIEVYIPEKQDYSQFGIEDFIKSMLPFAYVNNTFERNIFVLRVKGTSMSFDQYYKLVKYIIKEEGFCVIINQE